MPRSRWVTISLNLILGGVLAYLINQIPQHDKFPNEITNKEWWIIGATVLVTLLMIAITLWQIRQEMSEASESANDRSRFSSKKLLETRKQLLRRLQGDVKLRLETSLHQLTKLDLQMEDQQQQVGKSQALLVAEDPPERMNENMLNRVFQSFEGNTSAAPLQPSQKIIEVFERSDVQGKLLILGEPGTGKTTELLTLTQDLLQQAVDEASRPIPVIFDLSDWKEDKPIAQWLVEQLTEKYSFVPTAIGQQWLNEHQLLPLLDGLDELGLVRQQKCIEAIKQFLAEQDQPQCVVCCRREEYEQGQVELEQMREVYLRPLTDQQIEEYFQKLNRSTVWNNVQQNPELLELARKPLFLHMLVYAYQDNQGNKGRAIQNSQELFETYVEQRLSDPGSQGIYPPNKAPSPAQIRHYLVWLARRLEERHQTEFLIEGMQANWLGSVKQKRLYRVIVGLSLGLSLGLSSGLSFGLIVGPEFGLFFGLFFGLTGRAPVIPIEQLSWSWQEAKDGLMAGLLMGLSYGLRLGLIVGPSLGLINGLIGFEVENKTIPNQGIWRSVGNAVISGLIVGLLMGLLFGLSSGLLFGLSLGLLFGLMAGLFRGGNAVNRHCTLRLILHYNGYIPWNYARFLDHAVKHRFIQCVGGRYRFMHDLLRKHFAEMPE